MAELHTELRIALFAGDGAERSESSDASPFRLRVQDFRTTVGARMADGRGGSNSRRLRAAFRGHLPADAAAGAMGPAKFSKGGGAGAARRDHAAAGYRRRAGCAPPAVRRAAES